jgi:hypothetical protein
MEKQPCIWRVILVFFYVPKVLRFDLDLAKTVHFGKYYFYKLQFNFKNNDIFFEFSQFFEKFRKKLCSKNFEKFRKRTTSICISCICHSDPDSNVFHIIVTCWDFGIPKMRSGLSSRPAAVKLQRISG